jgi:hypothetical protein
MRQSIHPLGDTTYHFVKANLLNTLQHNEISALKDRIQRLEEAGDALCENSNPSRWDSPADAARKLTEQSNWIKAKEANP